VITDVPYFWIISKHRKTLRISRQWSGLNNFNAIVSWLPNVCRWMFSVSLNRLWITAGMDSSSLKPWSVSFATWVYSSYFNSTKLSASALISNSVKLRGNYKLKFAICISPLKNLYWSNDAVKIVPNRHTGFTKSCSH
jgi:hypothetical protein